MRLGFFVFMNKMTLVKHLIYCSRHIFYSISRPYLLSSKSPSTQIRNHSREISISRLCSGLVVALMNIKLVM
jgi:hypothetical protein